MTDLLARCDCTPLCRTSYDLEDGLPPSSAVVRAVAAAKETSPLEIAPLHDVVDLEALDTMVQHTTGDRDLPLSLQFSVDDLEVSLYGDGTVLVCDSEDSS